MIYEQNKIVQGSISRFSIKPCQALSRIIHFIKTFAMNYLSLDDGVLYILFNVLSAQTSLFLNGGKMLRYTKNNLLLGIKYSQKLSFEEWSDCFQTLSTHYIINSVE